MKQLATTLYLLLVVFVAAPTAAAQIKRPDDPRTLPSPFPASSEMKLPKTLVTGSESSVQREPRVLKKGLLAPSAGDRLDHEDFLKQSKTGLIRLLPREVYDWRVYHTPNQIEMRGGGAYFSFVHQTHEYGYGSDLELDHNQFSVGFAGADYGMLIRLGDVPLDLIAKDDPRLIYMSNYKPPSPEPEARSEARDFSKGREVDGFIYRRRVPARAQSTYLLRSINYGVGDVLVAFRVTRFDRNQSAIIAWKLLKSYSVPDLR